jgi:SNF2 family DNA or RNA helicase
MNLKHDSIHDMSLRPARCEEEYLLHRAALEWSLADPIIINSAEDIQSRANWRDRLKPYNHQVQNLFTFCRRLPVTLLADDVGLGKTISAGLILSELMIRRRVSRALILCPKILCNQWVEELHEKFGIEGTVVIGEQWADDLTRKASVVVTTYETARDRLDGIQPGEFDMLIMDEAHKLRNLHPGPSAPKLAMAVQSALEKRLFKYVVMLTGTPIHNCFWDLYSLIECLTVGKGHRNPLGKPDEFKQRYLLAGHDGRRLKPLQAAGFRRILREFVVRTRRGDARLTFPSRTINQEQVPLTQQEKD